MAIANCDQLANVAGPGSATAGLGGANTQRRAAEVGAKLGCMVCTFTIPASGAGSANGDQIKLPGLHPTSRFIRGRIIVPAGGLGAATTLALGKLDLNNSANNDNNHYMNPTNSALAGLLDAGQNLGEQVGVDPTGATTDTGDAVPGYGSLKVHPIITIGGAAPTAGQQIFAIIDYLTPGER